jgi:hypothetical protein
MKKQDKKQDKKEKVCEVFEVSNTDDAIEKEETLCGETRRKAFYKTTK